MSLSKSKLSPKKIILKNSLKNSRLIIRPGRGYFDKGTSINFKIRFKPGKNLELVRDESLIKNLLARDDYIDCEVDCGIINSCSCKMLIHDNIGYFCFKLGKNSHNSQSDCGRVMGVYDRGYCRDEYVSRVRSIDDGIQCLQIFRSLGMIDYEDDTIESLLREKGLLSYDEATKDDGRHHMIWRYTKLVNGSKRIDPCPFRNNCDDNCKDYRSYLVEFADKNNISLIDMSNIFDNINLDIIYLPYFYDIGLDESPTLALSLFMGFKFKKLDFFANSQNEPGFTNQHLKNAQDRLKIATNLHELGFLRHVIDCLKELKCSHCDQTIESDGAVFKFKTCPSVDNVRHNCPIGYYRQMTFNCPIHYYHSNCQVISQNFTNIKNFEFAFACCGFSTTEIRSLFDSCKDNKTNLIELVKNNQNNYEFNCYIYEVLKKNKNN